MSDTYRKDLAMLQTRIPADAHARLVKLAEDIQDARERDASGSGELDRRIAVYMNVREEALTQTAQRIEPVLGA
ncbi:hypothetical protein [Microbacterium nymphoidis]|uniref:hypothetical protein n=1 Tax=Microbacterium nymphoidis TaxID=2898586 RepID=UPI001E336626|nr:hypothetical protein [Microbacterium nymphoidis]MCD2497739.1 hypothetical protein [Microbacterium nymphoidis]